MKKQNTKSGDSKAEQQFDDVLRRMLATPPMPHKKPEAKKKRKKTAK